MLAGLASVFTRATGGGFFTRLFGKLFGRGNGAAATAKATAQIAANTIQVAQTSAEVAETVGGSGGIVPKLTSLTGGSGVLSRVVKLFTKAGSAAKTGLLTVATRLAGGSGLLANIAGMLGTGGPVGLAIAAAAAGGGLVIANWEKVKTWFGNFGGWLKKLFSGVWNGTKGFFSGIWNVGKNVGKGLWNGIKSVGSTLWNGVKSIGKGIVNGFKSFFGIHSPSTVMAEIGGYIGQGLANGIRDSGDGVNESMTAMTQGALDIATEAAQRMLDVADSDDPPIIRPLVDLSAAEDGADWLQENLTDGVRTVGLNVNRSAQLADRVTRHAEIQNGSRFHDEEDGKTPDASNREVVEAIGTLGERIDGVAEAVSRMKVTIDRRKFVGEIITDVDERLGDIAKKNRR